MDIRFNPPPVYKAPPNTARKATFSPQIRFAGDKPPKMPKFLKPYHERYLEKQKKQPGYLKTAMYVTGTVAGIVALAVTTHVFFPIALAGIATFVGVLALVMACFNKAIPNDKTLPELKPMTREQQMEASRYDRELTRFNRQQTIKKIKKFFGFGGGK